MSAANFKPVNRMNTERARRHGLASSEQAPAPGRGVGFVWFVALGSLVVAGLTIAAMISGFSGRESSGWAMMAMFGGFVLSLAPAVAPMLSKRPPSSSAPPQPWQSGRAAFISVSSLWMALYVLAISNINDLLHIDAWPRWAGFFAVIAAAFPVGAAIYALLRYVLREADEYQRVLLMRAALISAGVTLFVITLWGLLELYVGAPHIPLSMALTPFCVVFAIANWWIRGRT